MPRCTLTELHIIVVSDAQLVCLQALIPTRAPNVRKSSPNPDPSHEIRYDPVDAQFFPFIELAAGPSNDKPKVIELRVLPTDREIPRLLVKLCAGMACIAESEIQAVFSLLVHSAMHTPVGSICPNPEPKSVTIADPVFGTFVLWKSQVNAKSVENAELLHPSTFPLLTDILRLAFK